MTEESPVSICKWEFDSYNGSDKTKSWIELFETELGEKLVIFVNEKKILAIDADRDQWGTYISFLMEEKGVCVAQEDQTISFIDALIAALTRFKQITDFETLPPIFTESNNAQI